MTERMTVPFGRRRTGVVPALMMVAAMGCASAAAPESILPRSDGSSSPTNPPITRVEEGIFQIGKVRFDKAQKAVRFPAVLNLGEGIIEYLVVTSYGKTHESLLRTEAEPYHIHLAMLLLGAKGAGTNAWPQDPSQPLPGEAVSIELTWQQGRKEKRRQAEQCVYDRQKRSVMSGSRWVFTGSQIFEGTFVAQRDGSIVSLIVDPDALVNNSGLGRENDDNWTINKRGLPPPETPVLVILRIRG